MKLGSFAAAMVLCAGIAACTKNGAQERQPQAADPSRAEPEPMATLAPPTWHVSFYKLLAHSADYDGKRIQVHGVLQVHGDGRATLYPNLDSFRNSVLVDSIELTFIPALANKIGNLDGEFVALSGVFTIVRAPHTTYLPLGKVDPVERLLWLSESGLRPGYDTRRPSSDVAK
jgi:hypothetical protein